MVEVQSFRDNVDLLKLGDRSIYLIGTAHVSQSSADLATEIIQEIKPDSVAVELCEARYKSLQNPQRWKNTDIISVIREGKAYVLLAQLMLAGFQKKLGKHLKVKPGAEMMAAIAAAEGIDAEKVMADRNIKITLKRTWGSVGFFSMLRLILAMTAGLFYTKEVEEEEIERLKSADALEELLKEFSDILPDVRTSLIDERDQYLAAKIAAAPGQTIVAVVGAGHVPGIKKWIDQEIDLEPLETLPPPRKIARIIAWTIPIAVIMLILLGFLDQGKAKSFEMLEMWFWINASLGGIGALMALAHPLTVAAAFIAFPFTSLNPCIAGGWVAGLVEAVIRKPRVSDLENIAEDVCTVRGFWSNRVSKILLVICLTNLMGTLGTLLASWVLVELVVSP